MPPRRGIVWHHGWHDWMILLRQEISTMLSLAHVNSLAAGRRHGSWCCNMCTHAVDMQYMPRCKHWHAACCFSSQGYAPLLWWQQALQGPGLAARPGSDADKNDSLKFLSLPGKLRAWKMRFLWILHWAPAQASFTGNWQSKCWISEGRILRELLSQHHRKQGAYLAGTKHIAVQLFVWHSLFLQTLPGWLRRNQLCRRKRLWRCSSSRCLTSLFRALNFFQHP